MDSAEGDFQQNDNKIAEINQNEVEIEKEEEERERALFDPALYIQRYRAVANVIRKYGCSSVVDFGTAECKFLQILKNIECVENIAGVDINRGGLETRKSVCRPMTTDYLQPRKNPLRMRLFYGDLTAYDSRLHEFESVTLIEVIEHLHEPVLAVVPDAIFGKLNPKLVIVTTPNADYNVLLKNFRGKRHWDHKFEWCREEFKSWCENIAMKYNYLVEYQGLGAPPEGYEHLGSCSQMAVFEACIAEQGDDGSETHSHHKSSSSDVSAEQSPYELISDWQHPFQKDSVSLEQKITWEAKYIMAFIAREHAKDEQTSTEKNLHIDLEHILEFKKLKDICDDVFVLRDVLQKANYHLTADKNSVIYQLYPDTEDELDGAADDKASQNGSIVSGQFSDAEDDMTTPLSCEGLYAGLKDCVESWDD